MDAVRPKFKKDHPMMYRSIHSHSLLKTITIPVVAMSLALPSALHAQVAATIAAPQERSIAAENIVVNTNADGESHTIQLRVDGDGVSVIRDGKEIPHAQIVQDGSQIVITDKDGRRVQAINVKASPLGHYTFQGVPSAGTAATAVFEAPKVMLGVHMTAPTPALEYHLGLDEGKTTMINGIYEGLPAHEAGLALYDIITSVDGSNDADNESIRKALAERNPGDSVDLTIIHEGKRREITLKLAAYDASAMEKAKLIGDGENEVWTGVGQPWLNQNLMESIAKHPQVFIAPDGSQNTFEFQPMIEEMRLRYGTEALKQREGVNQQLERLDKRMGELEKLLERLIEKQERTR